MLIAAAAAAKSTEMTKIGTQSPFISPIPTRPSSPHGTPNNVASPQALCFTADKSSICRLQGGNVPIIVPDLDDILSNIFRFFIIYY